MIRPLLARNIRHHRILLISLLVMMALLELLIVWIAGHIESGPGIRELLEQVLPLGMRQLFGSQIGIISFAGLAGFGFQHPIALAGAIGFIIAVSTIPAGERESGFLDLLLARPVPRSSYFLAVLALLLLGSVILPLAPLIGLAVGLGLLGEMAEISWYRYLPAAFGLCCLLLSVAGYTLLLNSVASRRGTAAAQATGLTLLFFWIDLLSQIWQPMASIAWLSPFHYFKPVQSVIVNAAPFDQYAVLLGIFAVTSALAYLLFRRRDL